MGMSVFAMSTTSLFPHTLSEMNAMAGMESMPPSWSVGYAALMAAMWWIMMIAMMTPSAAPTILLYARVHRHAQNSGQIEEALVPTGAFALGYLVAWAGFALAATALQWGLETLGQVSSAMMWSQSKYFSAAILLGRGRLPVHPGERRLLEALQVAGPIYRRAFFWKSYGRHPHGPHSRRLLHRMLLGVNGASFCRRRDEHSLDRFDRALCVRRETQPARAADGPHSGRGADDLGRRHIDLGAQNAQRF